MDVEAVVVVVVDVEAVVVVVVDVEVVVFVVIDVEVELDFLRFKFILKGQDRPQQFHEKHTYNK